jgi:enoyl-CoA hydratase
MTDEAVEEVLVGQQGHLGRITLNRPRAINALTLNMVRLVSVALQDFGSDPSVEVIMIDGAGDRGLCAGGDIRAIYDAIVAGDDSPKGFWREEYLLNADIRNSAKPVVSLMDGVVMGGGVGISAHARYRVVTERSNVCMPEVSIGFSPDVGVTWLFGRAPGHVGTHAALTAARLGAADAIFCGLADVFVPTSGLPALIDALATGDPAAAFSTATTAAGAPPVGELPAMSGWIEECYDAASVAGILDRLDRSPEAGASAAAAQIRAHSPTAVSVALRALTQAREAGSFEACLEMEYQIACHFLTTLDFREGIRAAVIDKDRAPAWMPATLADVTAEVVEPFFRATEPTVFGVVEGWG